jgi:hypothetical protein
MRAAEPVISGPDRSLGIVPRFWVLVMAPVQSVGYLIVATEKSPGIILSG